MKKFILDLTKEELSEIIKPKYRSSQIFAWIYQKNILSFDKMSNISKKMIEELNRDFFISSLNIVKKVTSSDGSIKYLFESKDGSVVESVLLPMKEKVVDSNGSVKREAKYTICISSQVGCKIGCSFCLTAKGGYTRDLTPGEIVEQVLKIKEDNQISYNRRVNVVYMGMGEPLDNLENVSKSVKILNDPDGLSIGSRRITISTSGLSHQIERLGKLQLGVLLAISLHAVDDDLREKLMPINKAYNIKSIITAVKNFPIDQRKRVMFEYLVIDKVNDDLLSAKKLVKLLHGIKAKVNLIYFNPYPTSKYGRPETSVMLDFKKYLNNHGIICTIRQSKGLDISAACGQLKGEYYNELD